VVAHGREGCIGDRVQHLQVGVRFADALAPAGDESNMCRFGFGHEDSCVDVNTRTPSHGDTRLRTTGLETQPIFMNGPRQVTLVSSHQTAAT
jgi:hypothetical protein